MGRKKEERKQKEAKGGGGNTKRERKVRGSRRGNKDIEKMIGNKGRRDKRMGKMKRR